MELTLIMRHMFLNTSMFRCWRHNCFFHLLSSSQKSIFQELTLLKDEENEFPCCLHSCCLQTLMLSRAEFYNAENLHIVKCLHFAKCKYPLEMLGIGKVLFIALLFVFIILIVFKWWIASQKPEVSFPVLRSAHWILWTKSVYGCVPSRKEIFLCCSITLSFKISQ